MDGYSREIHEIDGIKTVVLTAGTGEPLVFFHGAGTFHGFDFALPWAEHFKLIVPYHPGFGDSADDERIDEVQDYILHYLNLFDVLGLDRFRLVGHSLGGRLAACFASQQPHRVERLALAAPAGLPDDEHPAADIFRVPPEQLPRMLVSDFEVIRPHLPSQPDPEFLAARYRESTATARISWERPRDPKLPRWLRRINMPTLIVWGEEDRLIPVGQGKTWQRLIAGARLQTYRGTGHLIFSESKDAVAAVAKFMT